ncbi:hypothetical protein GZH46_01149, partial [Fragariocoptes setiger]
NQKATKFLIPIQCRPFLPMLANMNNNSKSSDAILCDYETTCYKSGNDHVWLKNEKRSAKQKRTPSQKTDTDTHGANPVFSLTQIESTISGIKPGDQLENQQTPPS